MLQSVIRNLVDSVDEEDRITQRNKLEDDLTIASERLDALVQGVEERREEGEEGEGKRERGRGRRDKGGILHVVRQLDKVFSSSRAQREAPWHSRHF